MGLTRKFLAALGIDNEKADEIINAHVETLTPIKEERDLYKADSEKLADLQKKYDELKANSSNDDFQKRYDDIKKELDDYKANVEAEKLLAKKEKAFKGILKEIGISEKRIDAVVKVSGSTIDGIEFDDNGAVKEADKLKEGLKTEWSDFVVTTKQVGATTENPPANTGGSTMTKEQIRKIADPVQRQKAMAANPEMFGLEF